jgi:hypothetical protein
MTSAYATYSTSYEQRTPYLTPTEYNNAPTAMDVANLIAGGSAQANAIALQETINRASSWIDQYTCGAWGTLCATQNVENARIWGNRQGQFRVHPKYWPILSVDSFSYSAMNSGLGGTAASINPSGNIWIEPQEFIVQPTGTVTWNVNSSSGIATTEYFCEWTYTNGWPNTTLAASVAVGATSIQPSVITGIYPGTQLTIYDLPNDEPVTVAASYAPGNATVPLTSALQYAHATTATVTNLPPAIKQAAILATTAFIKQRGSGALEVADMGAITRQDTGFVQNSGSDWSQAEMLLSKFCMNFVGY